MTPSEGRAVASICPIFSLGQQDPQQQCQGAAASAVLLMNDEWNTKRRMWMRNDVERNDSRFK